MSTRRELQRQNTIHEIKARALEHLAQRHEFSLGAIARDMGMTTPALYRYFESREALVASLIQDGYSSLGGALEAAVAALPETAHAERVGALLNGYREWALEHPDAYALMVTEDIERAAPSLAAAARPLRLMIAVMEAAYRRGALRIPEPYQQSGSLELALERVMQMIAPDEADPEILRLAIILWIHFHGLVWQELHSPLLGPMLEGGEIYRAEVNVMCHLLGLVPR